MSGRSSPRSIAVVAILLALGLPTTGHAQNPQRFLRTQYDSAFRIGAHTVPGWPSLARDTLKLDFTYHYQLPWTGSEYGPR